MINFHFAIVFQFYFSTLQVLTCFHLFFFKVFIKTCCVLPFYSPICICLPNLTGFHPGFLSIFQLFCSVSLSLTRLGWVVRVFIHFSWDVVRLWKNERPIERWGPAARTRSSLPSSAFPKHPLWLISAEFTFNVFPISSLNGFNLVIFIHFHEATFVWRRKWPWNRAIREKKRPMTLEIMRFFAMTSTWFEKIQRPF